MSVLALQVEQYLGHQTVDCLIPFGRCCKNLLLGLHVLGRQQLSPTVFDKLPGRVGCGFQMKLKTQHPAPKLERLVFTGFAPGQQSRTIRQIERFAVPVEHCYRGRQAELVVRGRRFDGKPADLVRGVRIDLGTHSAGNQLGTETHA